jgi:hypothetical protein
MEPIIIQLIQISVLIAIFIGTVVISRCLVKLISLTSKLVDSTSKLLDIPEQQGVLLKRWWDWLHCLEKRYGTRGVEQDDSHT